MASTATQTGVPARDWRTALLAVSLLPILLSLGFWQLSRADEKRVIADRWEQRRREAPVDIALLPQEQAALAYRRVALSGEFIEGRTLLLDNSLREGRYGVEVITPLRLAGGELVLVNRGWLEGDPYRQQLPEVPPVGVAGVLEGYVYVPPGESYTLGDISATEGWPRLIQAIDMPALEAVLEEPLWPYTVRLSEDSPTALLADWPLVNAQPEKHQAYAFQWFAMAAALGGFALWRNRGVLAPGRKKTR